MSGLLFLSTEDFFTTKGVKGEILCHSIKGFSLILFYSTKCKHCQNLIPIFKKLPGSIGGCQFGMVNVSNNKRLIAMAKGTIAPITFVPYILMYIDGKPFMRYNGPQDINELRRFVLEVAKNVQNKQSFANKVVKVDSKKKNRIPEYTIGHPLCGEDDVCYLTFDEAYND